MCVAKHRLDAHLAEVIVVDGADDGLHKEEGNNHGTEDLVDVTEYLMGVLVWLQ